MNNIPTLKAIAELAETNTMAVQRLEQSAFQKLRKGYETLKGDLTQEEYISLVKEILAENLEKEYILETAQEFGVLPPQGLDYADSLAFIFSFGGK